MKTQSNWCQVMDREKDPTGDFDAEGSEPRALSIRLRRSTERLLRRQSREVGASLQTTIEMILEGFATLSWPEAQPQAATAGVRFLELMRDHELSLPEIVDVLSDFGFTLSALGDASRLRALLSREAVEHVAALFHVRPAWLTGDDERAVAAIRWTIGRFVAEIDVARNESRSPSVSIIRPARCGVTQESGYAWRGSPIVVVRREYVTPSGTVFATLQLWPFDQCLTAKATSSQVADLVAECRARGVPVSGIELHDHVMHELKLGARHPAHVLRCLLPRRWEPDALWEQACVPPPPVAARPADTAENAGAEPATTIDLYALLARQQEPCGDEN